MIDGIAVKFHGPLLKENNEKLRLLLLVLYPLPPLFYVEVLQVTYPQRRATVIVQS